MKSFLIVILAVLVSFAAEAKPKIHIVDGDSIFIGKREVRLSGIDAPEYQQICYDADDKEYRCGLRAMEALKAMVNNTLECQKIAVDRYHREVSVCTVDGEDLNKMMVAAGWAVAYNRYSHDYEAAEVDARNAKRGIWQGNFMKPELYRSLKRE